MFLCSKECTLLQVGTRFYYLCVFFVPNTITYQACQIYDKCICYSLDSIKSLVSQKRQGLQAQESKMV